MTAAGPISVVIHLVGRWETFHRRPMIEALAETGGDRLRILCVNPLLSLRESRGNVDFNSRLVQVHPNVWVFTPLQWIPFLGRLPGAAGPQIRRQVAKALKGIWGDTRPRAVLAWIYRPEQAWLLGSAREDLLVYEIYDEYLLDPFRGDPVAGQRAREDEILRKAAMVLTTSRGLWEARRARHSNVFYAPNGVNFPLFEGVRLSSDSLPEQIEVIPRPRIGYVGNITSAWLDFDLLRAICEQRPSWSVVLIGPVHESGERDLARLATLPNLYHLGPFPYETVPDYLRGLDIGLIPFNTHEWNRYRDPYKLWEYLAMGKPVVSVALPEAPNAEGLIYLANGAAEFIAAIEKALAMPPESLQVLRGVELARERSWDRLAEKVVEILTTTVASPPTRPFS